MLQNPAKYRPTDGVGSYWVPFGTLLGTYNTLKMLNRRTISLKLNGIRSNKVKVGQQHFYIRMYKYIKRYKKVLVNRGICRVLSFIAQAVSFANISAVLIDI